LGWVAVITALIWVYADLDRTVKEQVKARLVIHADSTGNAMVIMGRSEVVVTFDVKGSKHAISGLKGRRLQYDAAKDLGEGVHRNVSVAELLGKLDELRTAPIEIIGVDEPERLTIHVEQTKAYPKVPVEPDYTGGEPEGEPVIEPNKVDLYIPVSQIQAGPGEPGPLKVRIDLGDQAPGQVVKRRFAVRPPPRVVGAIIDPPMVMVTLKVARQPARKNITVPVRVQVPKDWLVDDTWTRYRLEIKDPLEWTKTIIVTGNRIDLERLRPEMIRAYIVLTEDDKQPIASATDGPVLVELPKGLDVRAEPVQPVSYKLVKRTSPAPPS
jgi:hypothetical protein